MSQNKILYLSYDGILEPLGYSQVFKYVEKLSKDFDISIVSFEKQLMLKTLKTTKSKGFDTKKALNGSNINIIINHKYLQQFMI